MSPPERPLDLRHRPLIHEIGCSTKRPGAELVEPCALCETKNRNEARFCRECGVWLGGVCISCGTVNARGSKFCDACGQVLSQPSPAAAAPVVDVPPTSRPSSTDSVPPSQDVPQTAPTASGAYALPSLVTAFAQGSGRAPFESDSAHADAEVDKDPIERCTESQTRLRLKWVLRIGVGAIVAVVALIVVLVSPRPFTTNRSVVAPAENGTATRDADDAAMIEPAERQPGYKESTPSDDSSATDVSTSASLPHGAAARAVPLRRRRRVSHPGKSAQGAGRQREERSPFRLERAGISLAPSATARRADEHKGGERDGERPLTLGGTGV